MMAKKNHGGTRKGAGRKPVDDPKVTFAIYPRKSIIDKLGVENAKVIAINALEKEAKKIKK
jgi:hypothetical protein